MLRLFQLRTFFHMVLRKKSMVRVLLRCQEVCASPVGPYGLCEQELGRKGLFRLSMVAHSSRPWRNPLLRCSLQGYHSENRVCIRGPYRKCLRVGFRRYSRSSSCHATQAVRTYVRASWSPKRNRIRLRVVKTLVDRGFWRLPCNGPDGIQALFGLTIVFFCNFPFLVYFSEGQCFCCL